MAGVKVRVDGLREIQDALHQLPKATAKNVMRRVLKARAQPIAEKARQLVPVDEGDLRDSIVVSTKLAKSQKKTNKKEHRDEVEMFVGPDNRPQAHWMEFGTFKDQAQPFMRPSWDSTKDDLLTGIAHDLWKEINKAADRMARKAAKAASGE
jgi:HK97 gp10 family phage protein